MKKRSSTGGKAAKARPRKVLKPKGRNFPKPPRSSSSADELMRVTRERDDSLQQQTATSDVLQVISRSPGDLQPVFETILKNAVRICDAKFGNIYRWDGNALSLVATHNTPRAYAEARRRSPVRPNPNNIFGSMVATKTVVHILDAAKQREQGNLEYVAAVELGGVRTCIAVPMLKENELIGSISLFRQEVCPFTDKQIALITNFAAQAVIAIENARLLNELRQRTDDLSEALQQQSATSEILEVISNSPTDSQPAFDAIVRSGLKLFPSAVIAISLPDGADKVKVAAIDGADRADLEALRARYPLPLSREYITSTAILDRRELDFADARDTPAQLIPGGQNFLASGYRAITVMPMMRGDSAIGAISVVRRQPGALSDKQRELLRSFANQAVIAIENTRLFNELRESLQEQTATSEVLQVISSSPGDLEPVFGAMLEKAVRICDANFGNIYRWDGDVLHLLASHNTPPALAKARKHSPLRPYPETPVSRMVAHKAAFHSADMTTMPGYIDRSDPGAVAAVELGGVRTILAIPMLNENEMIGSFSVYRQEVRPFTDKQIALVTNFAAQAVIAIENARLLTELRESLQEQTATSEVLRVISSSPGDLQPVFEAMLEKAVRICDATFGEVFSVDDGNIRLVAFHNTPVSFVEALKQFATPIRSPTSFGQRLIATKSAIQIADLAVDEDYIERNPTVVAAVELGRVRTILAVPMLKEDAFIGELVLNRQEVRPFTEKQIALVQNFASQAVIAIENARLLNELRESLQQQTATADVLKVISRSTFDLPKVLNTLVEFGGTALRCR